MTLASICPSKVDLDVDLTEESEATAGDDEDEEEDRHSETGSQIGFQIGSQIGSGSQAAAQPSRQAGSGCQDRPGRKRQRSPNRSQAQGSTKPESKPVAVRTAKPASKRQATTPAARPKSRPTPAQAAPTRKAGSKGKLPAKAPQNAGQGQSYCKPSVKAMPRPGSKSALQEEAGPCSRPKPTKAAKTAVKKAARKPERKALRRFTIAVPGNDSRQGSFSHPRRDFARRCRELSSIAHNVIGGPRGKEVEQSSSGERGREERKSYPLPLPPYTPPGIPLGCETVNLIAFPAGIAVYLDTAILETP